MIPPLNLDEEVEGRLKRWLSDEILLAQLELKDRDDKAVIFDKMYTATPDQKIKVFPWYKASNLVAPLAGIIVDAVYSRLANTLWAMEPFWSVRGRKSEYVELAEHTEDFLDYIQGEKMHMYDYLRSWLMEMVKVGTASFNLPWRTDKRKHVKPGKDGFTAEEVVMYDGPVIELIPWTDLLYRGIPSVIADADWKGYKVRASWYDLKRWEMVGWLHDVDRIKGTFKGYYDELEMKRGEMEGQTHIQPEYYELCNIQCGFDIDNDGIPEELFVVIEPTTATLLYVGGNPYKHYECTIHTGTYFLREHTLSGFGICHMLEPLQSAMSTMLNQTIDNATASNTVFIKARKNCGVKSGTRIFPMKVFELQDLNDIAFERFGQNNPAMFNLLGMMQGFAEKRTGMSDYNLGRESNIARYAATATSTLALLNESSRRFDTTLRDIRRVLGKAGMQVLQLYSQFKPKGADYEVLSEDGKAFVKMLLKLPSGMMRDKVVLEVAASSTAKSKPIEQQMYGQFFQMLISYYTQMVQGLQLATSPEVPPAIKEFAEEAAKGATEVMRKLIKTFEIKDIEKYLPDLDTIFQLTAIQTPPQLGPGMEGGNGGEGGMYGGAGQAGGYPGMAQ